MSDGGARRAVAEIRFGEDRAGLTKVGGRSIHQYWSLLSPHFRDVLLAPQRRSDDGGVAWNWRESTDRRPPTAAELASVRKRLERANESFAENPVNPLMSDGRSGTSSQALIDQVATKVKAMADLLAAKSDAALADFVCRTETGVMVHSWGVASPAQVVYPESLETGVSGVVIAGGKPAEGYEVVIENAQGLSVARVQSDETGEFHFSKLGPGRYRVRVISGRAKFPAKGATVTVERGAVTRLELRSIADSSDQNESTAEEAAATDETAPGSSATMPSKKVGGHRWIGKTLVILLVLLLIVGGGVWAWRTWSTADEMDKNVSARRSSMTPENFAGGDNGTITSKSSSRLASDGGGLGASVDGIGASSHRPALRSNNTLGGAAAPTSAGGRHSAATIGSKIEVLSGVADAPDSRGVRPNDVAEQPVDSDGGDTLESSSEESGHPVGLKVANTTANLTGKRSGRSMAGSLTDSPLPKGRGTQAAEVEATSSGKTNPPPDGIKAGGLVRLSDAKKKTTQQAKGIVATGESPRSATQANDEIVAPEAMSDAARPDAVETKNTDGGLPPGKGPTAKVSIVNKGLVGGGAHSSDESAASDAEDGAVGQSASMAGSAKAKRAKVTSSERANLSAKSAATDPGSTEGSLPEQSDPLTQQAAADKKDQSSSSAGAASKNGDAPTEPDSIGTDAASSAVPAVQDPRAARVKAKAASARAPVSPTQGVATKKIAASKVGLPPNAAPTDSSSDESALDSAAEHPHADNAESAVQVANKTLTVAILMTAFEMSMVRDTILPTLPVGLDEDDGVEPTRKKFVLAQQDRVPETFKHPSVLRSFIFELPPAPGGGAYRWEDHLGAEISDKTIDGNCAEFIWTDAKWASEYAHVLVAPDGHEMLRLSVDQKGSLALKVVEGVHCSLKLRGMIAPADIPAPTLGAQSTRFQWLINRVAYTATQKSDDLSLAGHSEPILIPFELAKGIQIKAALADRNTGWALVTKIQIQPVR